MAKLIIKCPEGERVHDIVDDVTSFGRAGTNIIQVKDEQASRQHCRIERSGDDYKLVDLGSRNGTLVNGVRVTQQTLKVGDEIVIGRYRMVFDTPIQVTAEELGGTVEVDTVGDKVSAVDAARVSAPEKPLYVIEVVEGAEAGKTVEVGEKPVTIGRHSSNVLPVSDEAASNYHAEITREAIGYVVTDLGSTNGTKVNGERVVKTALSNGSVIEIGKTRLAFKNLGKPTEEDQVFGTVVLDTEKLERELLEDESRSKKKLALFLVGSLAVLLVLLGAGYGIARLAIAVSSDGEEIAGNLLRNSSFDGETDDVGAPKGWRWQSNPNLLWEVVRSSDRLAERQMKGALSLTRRSQAPADAITFCENLEEVPVALDSGYKLGGYVRGEGAAGVYGFRAAWLGAGMRSDYDLAAVYGPQNEWKELTRVLNPPDWATHVRVWCFACGNHGRIFFDDVYLLPAGRAETGRDSLKLSGRELSAEFNDRGLAWVRSSGASVINSIELYLKSAEQGSPEALQGLGRSSSSRGAEREQFFEVEVVDFGTLAEFHLEERATLTRSGVEVNYTLTCPVGTVRALEIGLRFDVAESFAGSEPTLQKGEEGRTEEVVFVSEEGERFGIHVASGAEEVRTEARSGYWLVELVLAQKVRLRRVPMTFEVSLNPFSVFERRHIDNAWAAVEQAKKAGNMALVLPALEKIASMEGFPEDASKAKLELDALRRAADDDMAEAIRKVDEYIKAVGEKLRETTRTDAANTVARLKEKWAGTSFEEGYVGIEVKMAKHEDSLVHARREEEAEELRQRVLKFFDAKAWSMVIIYSDKLFKEYAGTQAADKLKEQKVREHASQRQKEEEDVGKAIDRLNTRLRNLTMNRLYKEAVAEALQSQEYRQYGSHPRMQEFIGDLKAKAGVE